MSTAIDTNILARALLNDDVVQSPVAQDFLANVEEPAISIVVFTELVWVLRTKKVPNSAIVKMLETLVAGTKIRTDHVRFDAGLEFMKRGGDFADGVVLHDARHAHGTPVRTFDRTFAQLGAPDVTLLS